MSRSDSTTLFQVPVFEKEIRNVTDDLKTKFRNYYIGDLRVNVKKSKYSGEYSVGKNLL